MRATATVIAAAAAGAAVAGVARRHVTAPPKPQTNVNIGSAVADARRRALPSALADARRDAGDVGGAAGLQPGRVVGIRRDVAPLGAWWADEDSGSFGPGKWCGRIYVGRRIVHRADGTTRRKSRFRNGCRVPTVATARITVTFAAQTG
jgi:hypothetical protein